MNAIAAVAPRRRILLWISGTMAAGSRPAEGADHLQAATAMPGPAPPHPVTALLCRKERPGRYCRAVECTHSWWAGLGRLRIRFESRIDIHPA